MLSSQGAKRKKNHPLCLRKTLKEVSLFHFPSVKGMEDVSLTLNAVEADSLFSAMLHAFSLRPIETEVEARSAERVLEYLERAFEQDIPLEIEHYREVLALLVSTFDARHYVRAIENLKPHELLRALLKEDGLCQKALVPDCFKSESQASEFLHQREGRKELSYNQAVALGRRFHIDPIHFLRL